MEINEKIKRLEDHIERHFSAENQAFYITSVLEYCKELLELEKDNRLMKLEKRCDWKPNQEYWGVFQDMSNVNSWNLDSPHRYKTYYFKKVLMTEHLAMRLYQEGARLGYRYFLTLEEAKAKCNELEEEENKR